MRTLAALLALALSACASGPVLRDYALSPDSVELARTPFFSQAEYQCGPAALATVLNASGITVALETLTPQVYLPQRKGSLQAEMVAATRRYGRVPYVLRPELTDLLAELKAGTPVLVLQNLGLSLLPIWHYAVVIGYDVPSDSLLLRSGTEKNLRMTRHRFEASWDRAQRWALVTMPPTQIPVTATGTEWLQAASAFEELGQPVVAAEAYTAATRRWPVQARAWQALANARYALRDLTGAQAALRTSLKLEPSAATYNNLAHVLLERGCPKRASAELDRADAAADAANYAATLARTRATLKTRSTRDAPGCSH